VYNPDQKDSNNNGKGDACEPVNPCATQGGDTDGDGVCNNVDNCPTVYNPDQKDSNNNGKGDACEPVDPCASLGGDKDKDGVCAANDCDDNDPNVPNKLPCNTNCHQNGCTIYRGNVDFIAIGNSMNFSEDRTNCNKKTNSSASLSIPNGTQVKSAILYWSGSDKLDNTATLNGHTIHSSKNWETSRGLKIFNFYAAKADVTNIVKSSGSGNYTVGDISWVNDGGHCVFNSAYGAWALVVVYEGNHLPANTIHICENEFKYTDKPGRYTQEFTCINPPKNCNPNAELTIIAFEGDNYKGENFYLNGQKHSGNNNFRGQTAPNLDIVSFNIDNHINSNTSSFSYTIETFTTNSVFGLAIEGLLDFVKIVKYGCNSSSNSRNAPMLDFTAFPAQREVELQWATNTSYRNAYYIIEKSIDGANFENIQRVENLENSDQVELFNAIDFKPALGDNYYRVKQVYKDGSFDYTDVKNVRFNIDLESLSMYPNPAQDELNLNLKAIAGKEANIKIINNFGQVVQQVDIGKVENNNVRIPLNNLENGFYQVHIQVDKGRAITKKLIIDNLR
jgi:hypothetical protein